MISEKLAPYFATFLGSAINSCTYRYVPQNVSLSKPIVVVETPFSYEDGSNTSGASKRKICTFNITIIGKTHNAIIPVSNSIRSQIPEMRQIVIDGVFLQCLLIEDIDTQDTVYLSSYGMKGNPSGNEEGYPSLSYIIRGSYNDPNA